MANKVSSFLTGSTLLARITQGVILCFLGILWNIAWKGSAEMKAEMARSGYASTLAILIGLSIAVGGTAGAVYFGTEGWRRRGGWHKTVANVVFGVLPGVVVLLLLGLASVVGSR